jgi:hypothetical protein
MFNYVVDGWPLLPIVIGLVQFIKQMLPKLEGRGTMLVAFLLGASLGGSYLWSQRPPVDFLTWFVFIVGILVYGLVPLGLYGVSTKNYQLQKITARQTQLLLESQTPPPSIQPK